MNVTFEFGGETNIESVDLWKLRIWADTLDSNCTRECAAAGGESKRCDRRERICIEEGGGSILCGQMRDSCIQRESSNAKGFEGCFASCVQKKLPELFKDW